MFALKGVDLTQHLSSLFHILKNIQCARKNDMVLRNIHTNIPINLTIFMTIQTIRINIYLIDLPKTSTVLLLIKTELD